MEWLKTVTELRGSVEKSSLTRAQRINKRGIYIIGKETEKNPTVENSLRLQICPKKNDENQGQYLRRFLLSFCVTLVLMDDWYLCIAFIFRVTLTRNRRNFMVFKFIYHSDVEIPCILVQYCKNSCLKILVRLGWESSYFIYCFES